MFLFLFHVLKYVYEYVHPNHPISIHLFMCMRVFIISRFATPYNPLIRYVNEEYEMSHETIHVKEFLIGS